MPSKAAQSVDATAAARDGSSARDGHDAKPREARDTIDLGEIEFLKILDEHGNADAPLLARFDPPLEPTDLLGLYRDMVLTRKFDERMLTMQRQGQMGTFAPGLGQEAVQIGQVEPLREIDWYSPSYRSFGAQIRRGWTMEGLMLLWDGFFEGFEIPEGVNDLPFSIVIGSHVPVATGVGMAIKARGEKAVCLTNFGDGALSQGPVAEAMNFAAVYKAPVVFVCENNGYAISVPTRKQAGIEELARRGAGFGIPSIRVDGNDLLAMTLATREAVAHARAGKGPFFIEAVTYRMSLHTTADDPKVYRDDAEVEAWKPKCPIARLERYLQKSGLADRDLFERTAAEGEQAVLDAREKFRARAAANPHEVFDYMYDKLPPELEAQKREYLEKLKRKGL